MGKKQKTYSTEVKARVALEALRGQKTVAQIASEHQVHPTQVNQWKKQAMETLRAGFSGKKGKRSTNNIPSAGGEKKGGVSQVGVVGCSMDC